MSSFYFFFPFDVSNREIMPKAEGGEKMNGTSIQTKSVSSNLMLGFSRPRPVKKEAWSQPIAREPRIAGSPLGSLTCELFTLCEHSESLPDSEGSPCLQSFRCLSSCLPCAYILSSQMNQPETKPREECLGCAPQYTGNDCMWVSHPWGRDHGEHEIPIAELLADCLNHTELEEKQDAGDMVSTGHMLAVWVWDHFSLGSFTLTLRVSLNQSVPFHDPIHDNYTMNTKLLPEGFFQISSTVFIDNIPACFEILLGNPL